MVYYISIYSIVTCQRIARQRLDKHTAIRARNNRTNVHSLLLGNSQRANGLARKLLYHVTVFCMVCSTRQ
jgi:hypothetical protein